MRAAKGFERAGWSDHGFEGKECAFSQNSSMGSRQKRGLWSLHGSILQT